MSAKQELLKEVPRPEAGIICGTIDASILRMLLLFLDWCPAKSCKLFMS
jgi:hypothetical protein